MWVVEFVALGTGGPFGLVVSGQALYLAPIVWKTLSCKFFFVLGRGVVSTVARERGDFLLFYVGDIITNEEGEKREEVEPSGYRFFFKDKW